MTGRKLDNGIETIALNLYSNDHKFTDQRRCLTHSLLFGRDDSFTAVMEDQSNKGIEQADSEMQLLLKKGNAHMVQEAAKTSL